MESDLALYFDAIDDTWPAARRLRQGLWTIRDGAGGGKRVSAATLADARSAIDIAQAEAAMAELGQQSLFMVREDQAPLDDCLENAGYETVGPVNIYGAPVDLIAKDAPPRLSAFDLWPPLAIQKDIWAAGGIGPSRLAVMARAKGPKTALFGRQDGRPAATGFVAISKRIAMVHALEVLPDFRRRGVGRNLTCHAAHWARSNGAHSIAVLCTEANEAANALYTAMGFERLGGYHYRRLEKAATL